MGGVVLWFGPVTAANLSGALPAGWRLSVHNRGAGGGLGSSAFVDEISAFRDWANTLGLDPLTALGVRDEPCVMAGFSAAHGAHEPILARVAARRDERLAGLFGFDAYYTSYIKAPKPGHLAWLSWVRDDARGRVATFTTSTHAGADHPSASASFRPLATALGMQPRSTVPPFGARPERAYGVGSIRWFDYASTYKHTEHATVLARQFVRAGLSTTAPASPDATPRSSGGLPLLSLAMLAWRTLGDS